jgi:hypothetical protein
MVVAVGGEALAKYEAGADVRPEDIAGARLQVKLKTERRAGFTRSVIEDYRPLNSSGVVNLVRGVERA